MQLLHASFSSTLAFHCSTSPPKGRHVHVAGKSVVELITATSFSSQRYLRPACVSYSDPLCSSISPKAASSQAAVSEVASQTAETDVLKALSQIIDPDFGTDIVSCGFVKDLDVSKASGEVSFRLELTTPACPVKDMFEQKAHEVVAALPWVEKVKVTMSAQPARPVFAGQLPAGRCIETIKVGPQSFEYVQIGRRNNVIVMTNHRQGVTGARRYDIKV
ncbi:hypothetical protein Pfo_003630 [Paulownia fortunei]|nr:hypothetical protein Pfo_003630 [Paulownia fortunei]